MSPMQRYALRRIALMIPTLFAISLVVFLVMQAPPGDFMTTILLQEEQAGLDQTGLNALREQYGLDQPVLVQYGRWIWNIVAHGDLGYSFKWNRPVSDLIWDRLWLTLVVSLSALMLTWLIALPAGIVCAVFQYSPADMFLTITGFIGLSIPNFLLGLITLYAAFTVFGVPVGGLYSPEFENASWSVGKALDLLSRLWIPALIVGLSGTAALLRTMRANLLDELCKPYVVTARAKGMREATLILRYPVRLALNPFVSTMAWVLPSLIAGEIIVSIVMSLPTTGPLLLDALLSQDMYLAGAILLFLSLLTVVGTLLSDIMLAWLDPRIRYQ